jgi:hypothetical protein
MSVAFSGNAQCLLRGVNAITGNDDGSTTFGGNVNRNLSPTAVAPDVVAGGGYQGVFTAVTGGTLLNLANGSSIVISGGAVVSGCAPAQGYVISGAKKLKALYLENLDDTRTVTVSIPSSNGLAGLGWVGSGVVVVLQPRASAMLIFPTGSSTLTSGSNDGLTFTSSAASPNVKIAAAFG